MIRGKVHKFGKNIDTDAIIASKYANFSDPLELGKHCMENIDPDFGKRVEKGDIIVATTNFGCGSSREIAPMTIKGAGISAVVAKSFARIFFRNAINTGLPLLECAEAVEMSEQGDVLEIDLSMGTIRNVTKNLVFSAVPYPEFITELIEAGGLVEYVMKKMEEDNKKSK
ncbi:MAG TPA: 3-isopropylmalate dehydratase small subunit [Syntrophorhabdaceae bacterium]|nr:3-isopropylmalate dehydratase small subunit [Syntrophorhabdaceae bacterium]